MPANSTWSHEAVGRAYIQMEKRTMGKWKRLTRNEEKPPHMYYWWSMQEKFKKEVKDDE